MRKTTIIVLVVFFAFFVHRFVTFWMEDRTIQDVGETALSPALSVVCRNVVGGTPFGVDSVFDSNTRLHYYSTISNGIQYSGDTLKHVWFFGTDTVQSLPCEIKVDVLQSGLSVCHTEISPKLLKPGEWSVDLVAGRKLLSSKQFLIEDAGR